MVDKLCLSKGSCEQSFVLLAHACFLGNLEGIERGRVFNKKILMPSVLTLKMKDKTKEWIMADVEHVAEIISLYILFYLFTNQFLSILNAKILLIQHTKDI